MIGGGGYTLPRCVATLLPSVGIDVVEIDPGVTRVAYDRLGLDPALSIATFNQDGRQFLEDRPAGRPYAVVTLDAVNDFAVPSHLLTYECHEAVRRSLTPDGVYLVTVIDRLERGRLWKAVVHTLRESFAHVEVLSADAEYDPSERHVYSLYASAKPLDASTLSATRVVPHAEVERLLAGERVVLTDQYAPVDHMMSGVFRGKE